MFTSKRPSQVVRALTSCSLKIRLHGIEANGLVGVLAATVIVVVLLLH